LVPCRKDDFFLRILGGEGSFESSKTTSKHRRGRSKVGARTNCRSKRGVLPHAEFPSSLFRNRGLQKRRGRGRRRKRISKGGLHQGPRLALLKYATTKLILHRTILKRRICAVPRVGRRRGGGGRGGPASGRSTPRSQSHRGFREEKLSRKEGFERREIKKCSTSKTAPESWEKKDTRAKASAIRVLHLKTKG